MENTASVLDSLSPFLICIVKPNLLISLRVILDPSKVSHLDFFFKDHHHPLIKNEQFIFGENLIFHLMTYKFIFSMTKVRVMVEGYHLNFIITQFFSNSFAISNKLSI